MAYFSPFVRQLGAVGLLILLVSIIAGPPVKSYLDYVDGLKEQLHDQRLLRGRLLDVIAARDSGEQRTPDFQQSQTADQLLIPGTTDPVRAAFLLELIAESAKQEGVRTKSTNALASYTANGLRFVGVQVTLTATLQQIQNMLVTLEGRKPYVFVASLKIGETNVAGADPELLDIRASFVGASIAQSEEEEAL